MTVDGEVVAELGRRVDPFQADIAVDGEPLAKRRRLYYAVNKPEGYVCTMRDPAGRPRVTDLVPPDSGRVFTVGRLDMASEGLILLTNDGDLANLLAHPRHGVKKVYHAAVVGTPTAETLAQLRRGVHLSDGFAHFVDARVKSKRKGGSILEVVLDEGKNREVRRVLARVGHKVQRLTRVAVGPVRLADLPAGAYRPLTSEEVRGLREAPSAPEGRTSAPSRDENARPGGRKPPRRPLGADRGRGAPVAGPGKRTPRPAGGPASRGSKRPHRAAAGDRPKPTAKRTVLGGSDLGVAGVIPSEAIDAGRPPRRSKPPGTLPRRSFGKNAPRAIEGDAAAARGVKPAGPPRKRKPGSRGGKPNAGSGGGKPSGATRREPRPRASGGKGGVRAEASPLDGAAPARPRKKPGGKRKPFGEGSKTPSRPGAAKRKGAKKPISNRGAKKRKPRP